MSEWKNFELKELTTKIGSGATPRGGQEAYKKEGVSLIRSQNILDFSFSYSGLAFIDDEQAHGLKNVILEEDDILINITGDSVARVAKVPTKVLPARVNQHVAILRANKSKLDSDYLLYYLLNPVFKRHLLQISSDGATRNALTKTHLEDLIIVAPESINEQKEIANLLSVYDQKITLLRQQNQDLEELAQTLFKRWFVEFEFPYDFAQGKPSENGEPHALSTAEGYKSSGGKMVESELGEIPEGWRVSNIGELAENKAKTYKFSKKEVVFINTGDVLEGKFLHKNYLNPEGLPGQAKKALELNDILFSEIRPKNKRFAFVDFDASDYVVSTKFMIIKTKGEIHAHILYLILKEENSIVKINHIAEARSGTFPQITFDSISDFEILKAPLKVQDKFMDLLLPTMRKQKNNEQEIQTLTQLRDTLLPKLMSGEIRVIV